MWRSHCVRASLLLNFVWELRVVYRCSISHTRWRLRHAQLSISIKPGGLAVSKVAGIRSDCGSCAAHYFLNAVPNLVLHLLLRMFHENVELLKGVPPYFI